MKRYFIFAMVLFAMGWKLRAQSVQDDEMDDPEWSLRHDMSILHADVRKEALKGFQRRFNLTDDEFSERLVRLATVMTNGEEATLRVFTVAALSEFGTTNALNFLENEALHGGDVAGGIRGYGAVTDYDERFISLARQMTEDKRMDFYRRRVVVYNAMRPILYSVFYHGRQIGNGAKERVKDFLLLAAKTDPILTDYIDGILCEGIDSYSSSEARREIILGMLDNPELVPSARDYYKNELRKLNDASKSEMPVQPSRHLHHGTYIVFALTILVAVLLLVAAGVRHKRK